jgi:cell wall-associated NlpC family hydrolase
MTQNRVAAARQVVVAEAVPPDEHPAVDAIAVLRRRVLDEARGWLGTPYHHMGRVKGAGVDCLTFLAEVYERAGVIGHVEIPFYPPDWNLHRSEELYVGGVLGRAIEVAGPPQPGDIALFKFGRCFAHGAIVTSWPRLIHAHARAGAVIRGDATQPDLVGRAVKFFNPFQSLRGAQRSGNLDRPGPVSRPGSPSMAGPGPWPETASLALATTRGYL